MAAINSTDSTSFTPQQAASVYNGNDAPAFESRANDKREFAADLFLVRVAATLLERLPA